MTLSLVAANGVAAQQMYRYQDESGHWVYTDRQPDHDEGVETLSIEPSFVSPQVIVNRVDSRARSRLLVRNTYVSPVEVGILLDNVSNLSFFGSPLARLVVEPSSEAVAVELVAARPTEPWRYEYRYQYVVGSPEARHLPEQPYRIPFATGQAFTVTQAYPKLYTHGHRSSQYAVDIAMPEGTGIYAAREGLVIDIATQFFENGTDQRLDGPRANHVRILHEDGSMAIYAHLQWDSIRVRPGQTVARGEYIADSGNTGFSTGPHLHFDVQVNTGLALTSMPFEFESEAGVGFVPEQGQLIRAR